ncbi:hypothetical protein [Flammeovirga agarivorans]|uniref:Lipoprotein n=1 Tax=Flammeovirga agarivorans TaxID=2726742 RepID=A0A7X8SRF9_9BACT|nr:hypothetical protein [Flammeovirga agarivorans]NLR95054.1 hypothetical protein [Flammeovirga agarivorans]
MLKKLFFILLTITSCSVRNYDLENSLNQELEKYDSSLVDHFPKKIYNSYKSTSLHYYDDFYESPHLYLVCNPENFSQLVSEIKIKSVEIYKSNTKDCLNIVDGYINKKNRYYYDRTKRRFKRVLKNGSCNSLPLPNFYSIYSDNKINSNKLLKGFDYYLLSCSKGTYLDSTHKIDTIYTLENWEHGYSKGIALNEKKEVAIYWLCIW